jgi:predicted nucleic acid-binding protein
MTRKRLASVITRLAIAPDLVVAEVDNALWKHRRRAEMSRDAAAEIVDEVAGRIPGVEILALGA